MGLEELVVLVPPSLPRRPQKHQGEADHDKVTAESKLAQCYDRLAVIDSTINEMETKVRTEGMSVTGEGVMVRRLWVGV